MFSELIPPDRKIEFESCKRSDSELSKKNGGIIRPKGIFFETFWANSSGGFEGPQTFLAKIHLFFSLFIVSLLFLSSLHTQKRK